LIQFKKNSLEGGDSHDRNSKNKSFNKKRKCKIKRRNKMKKSLQLIMGTGILLLFTASVSFSQAYFVSIPGCAFMGFTETEDWWIDTNAQIYKDTSGGWLYAQVVFPNDLKYIERMGITYWDFTATGQIEVGLWKKNRWDGTASLIAFKTTGIAGAANMVRTTSVILGLGRGIDNANYSYYVRVYFSESGKNLRLHQVTFKCQY
jgi:hypothetical protein